MRKIMISAIQNKKYKSWKNIKSYIKIRAKDGYDDAAFSEIEFNPCFISKLEQYGYHITRQDILGGARSLYVVSWGYPPEYWNQEIFEKE
jgi:hypothetical protein